MRLRLGCLIVGLSLSISAGVAQNASSVSEPPIPTFVGTFTAGGKQYTYTVAGRAPELGGTTTIPTVIVPVSLVFDGDTTNEPGKKLVLDATPDVFKVVKSPIFQKFSFATGTTQYGDAVQRAEFYKDANAKTGLNAWHTLLGQPRIARTLQIEISPSDGYVLTSKRSGRTLAVVDLKVVEKQLFQQLAATGANPNELVIALTKNTMFYPLNDATVCCSWGNHGVHVDPSSKSTQAFVLGTYLDPGVVPRYSDIQALTQQIAEWMNDPLRGQQPNQFPAWRGAKKNSGCGGRGMGTAYRLAEPTDALPGSNTTSVSMHGTIYHLENVALLPWFAENTSPDTFQGTFSFPDTHALAAAARPCSARRRHGFVPIATPIPITHPPNGHKWIGYWTEPTPRENLPLRDVSPQWDVVIVAFAPPVKDSTSQMYFDPPIGETAEQFKSDIEFLQRKGKKVLISLGGGGEVVTLNASDDLRNFVSSVGEIVRKYGFDGIDLDFETPSLILQPGDTDFRRPTTPSIVNLITAMHQLHRRFGRNFMIAEVPEGPQVPAALEVYAGQFGSFLPVIYGTRDILSFVDVQNYNTPPLGGLDGNYYMPGTADYYVAMAEMMVHGFPVAGNAKDFFPALPPQKVAIGLMAGPSEIPTIKNALRYLIQGKPYNGGEYTLWKPAGYRNFNGAMLWNIQIDRRENYRMSNAIGPFLHDLPAVAGPPSRAKK